ncbi:MAG: GNAT family N-acetyltransferase [Hyphomicrobiales bacterium]
MGDDVGVAADLLIRFFREEGFDTPDAVIHVNTQRMATIEACGLFIAESGEKPIGVATMSLEFGIEFGWSGEMGDLYVLPDWRGRGVSQALVVAVEAFLKERGAGGYQVTVTPFAEEAHGLQGYYRKLGFSSEGRLILYKKL